MNTTMLYSRKTESQQWKRVWKASCEISERRSKIVDETFPSILLHTSFVPQQTCNFSPVWCFIMVLWIKYSFMLQTKAVEVVSTNLLRVKKNSSCSKSCSNLPALPGANGE